jgi:hypothetical protein
MKKTVKKLFIGKDSSSEARPDSVLKRRANNIAAIWKNEHHEDIGIEKMLRLFLALTQFVFAGTYIKHIFGKKGVSYQELSLDVYILIKVTFPIYVLYAGLYHNPIIFFFVLWFLAETVLYIPTLIFASDIFTRPRSYRRSMLLLFLNYIEIIVSFGVIYARGNYFNQPFNHWFDPIYFSCITSFTVGYGDYFPVTPVGKFFVSVQSLIFLVFVVLFLNFFSNKVEKKGYFNNE